MSMIPIQFVPVNVDENLFVFEKDRKIIILNELNEDVTHFYEIKVEKRGNTETVMVKLKRPG